MALLEHFVCSVLQVLLQVPLMLRVRLEHLVCSGLLVLLEHFVWIHRLLYQACLVQPSFVLLQLPLPLLLYLNLLLLNP